VTLGSRWVALAAAALALLPALATGAPADDQSGEEGSMPLSGRPALPVLESRLQELGPATARTHHAHSFTGFLIELARVIAGYRRPESLALNLKSTPPSFADLLTTARRLLSTPYSWGGVGPDAYDCSGFVNKVYAENGYALPRVSRQIATVGDEIIPPGRGADDDELQPGDLLFWASNPNRLDQIGAINHVGMYIGDGEFIHAAKGHGVIVSHLDSRWYSRHFVTARRVLGLDPGVLDPGCSKTRQRIQADGAVSYPEHEPVSPEPVALETRTTAVEAEAPETDRWAEDLDTVRDDGQVPPVPEETKDYEQETGSDASSENDEMLIPEPPPQPQPIQIAKEDEDTSDRDLHEGSRTKDETIDATRDTAPLSRAEPQSTPRPSKKQYHDATTRYGPPPPPPPTVPASRWTPRRTDGTRVKPDATTLMVLKPTEHREEPSALESTSAPKSVIADMGPRRPVRPTSTIGLKLGSGFTEDRYVLVASPQLSILLPEHNVGAIFAFPLGMVATELDDPRLINQELFASWHHYTNLIHQVRVGQKEAMVFFDLSRTGNATIGHGQIFRNHTPNLGLRQIPGWNLERNSLSLAFDLHGESGGFELFIDDVLNPFLARSAVFAGRLFLRPFGSLEDLATPIQSLTLAAQYGGDTAAPRLSDPEATPGAPGSDITRAWLHVVSGELETVLLDRDYIDWTLYFNASSLRIPDSWIFGGSGGMLWRIKIMKDSTFWIRLRAEGRLHQANFQHSYFDATYPLQRRNAARVDSLDSETIYLPKLTLLERRPAEPIAAGICVETTLSWQRRVTMGVLYEDDSLRGDTPDDGLGPRSFAASLDLRYIPIPWTSMLFDLYFVYHLRHFDDESDFFQFDSNREYFAFTGSLKLHSYFYLNSGLRIASSENEQDWVMEGVVDLSFEYPF